MSKNEFLVLCFSPTAESFGVSAQIGSGGVWGGPEVRFKEGSTRVPPGFHQGRRDPEKLVENVIRARIPKLIHQGSTRAAGWCEH